MVHNHGDCKSLRPGVVGPLPNGLFMAYKFWVAPTNWVILQVELLMIKLICFMTGQPTPPKYPSPRNKALVFGLIDHWFRLLIRPKMKLLMSLSLAIHSCDLLSNLHVSWFSPSTKRHLSGTKLLHRKHILVPPSPFAWNTALCACTPIPTYPFIGNPYISPISHGYLWVIIPKTP